jgi:hypothetical protein
MTEKKNIPGTPDFVERRSDRRRGSYNERRGPLRWDPTKKDRRRKKERRKRVNEEQAGEVPPAIIF